MTFAEKGGIEAYTYWIDRISKMARRDHQQSRWDQLQYGTTYFSRLTRTGYIQYFGVSNYNTN